MSSANSTLLTGTSIFIPEGAYSDSEEEDSPLDKTEELQRNQKSEELFQQLFTINGQSYLDKIPKIDEDEIDQADNIFTVRYIFAKMLKGKGVLFQGYKKEDKMRFVYFKAKDDQDEERYVCIFNIAARQNLWSVSVSTFTKFSINGKKDMSLRQCSYTLIDKGLIKKWAHYKNLKNFIHRALHSSVSACAVGCD